MKRLLLLIPMFLQAGSVDEEKIIEEYIRYFEEARDETREEAARPSTEKPRIIPREKHPPIQGSVESTGKEAARIAHEKLDESSLEEVDSN